MKTLSVEDRLEYARAGVAVLRVLAITDQNMPHQQFARAIGLLHDGEKWGAWYRSRTGEIINDISLVARKERLAYHRLIDARTGEPGAGLARKARVVRPRSSSKSQTKKADLAADPPV